MTYMATPAGTATSRWGFHVKPRRALQWFPRLQPRVNPYRILVVTAPRDRRHRPMGASPLPDHPPVQL